MLIPLLFFLIPHWKETSFDTDAIRRNALSPDATAAWRSRSSLRSDLITRQLQSTTGAPMAVSHSTAVNLHFSAEKIPIIEAGVIMTSPLNYCG